MNRFSVGCFKAFGSALAATALSFATLGATTLELASATLPPAFPGAQGFGSTTVGGSGRHLKPAQTTIFRIRSLADSGPDTLRECVSSDKPRTCLFETSGRIILKEALWIRSPYITIAGQTAPEPGILISGAGIVVASHDVVIRHLTIRVGDAAGGPRPTSRDGVTIHGKGHAASNIVLDHLSISWALDENASTYGDDVHDVTLMNCIFSEGLYHSIHPDGPHSMGMLIGEGSRKVTVHRSLFAHNNDRNPRQKGGTTLEFYNNLIYGWGGLNNGHMLNPADTDHTNAETLTNFAGNCYRPAPQSPHAPALWGKPLSEKFRAYVSKNIGPTRSTDSEDDWKIAGVDEFPYRSPKPAFAPSGVTARNGTETCTDVPLHAGSRPAHRSAADQRVLEEVRSGTGGLKDCISGCDKSVGGWPEIAVNSRELHVPHNPFADANTNGYTDLEDWANCLAKAVEGGTTEASCHP